MAENRTNGSLALEEKQYKVITIEPAQKPQSIQLRVAAYARVSTSSNDQMNSFARNWTFQLVLQLLRNEKYTGDSLWQKSYSSDTFPVVRYKNHGEREQYYAMQTHPPIISKDTFEIN